MAVLVGGILVWRSPLAGPWIDEYATLWFSDPVLSIGKLYATRWSSETNPPLYYLLVRFTRAFTGDDILRLRLLNVPFFFAAYFYAAISAWVRPQSRYFILIFALLCLTGTDHFEYFSLARSYDIQFSCLLALCLSISFLLFDGDAGLQKGGLAVLAFSLFVLCNIHFMSALLAACIICSAIAALAHRRRFVLASTLAVLLAIALLPTTVFLWTSFGNLAARTQGFWVNTSEIAATLMMLAIAIRTYGFDLAILYLSVPSLRRSYKKIAGADAPNALLVAIVFASAVLCFFVLLLVANSVRSIVLMRYIAIAGIPLSLVAAFIITPIVRQSTALLAAILVIGLVIATLRAGSSPFRGDYAGIGLISGMRATCPDTQVFGVWGSKLYQRPWIQIGYRYVSDHFNVPMQIRQINRPWTPRLSASCPTVLWAAQLSNGIESAAAFSVALQLTGTDLSHAEFRRLSQSYGAVLILPARRR